MRLVVIAPGDSPHPQSWIDAFVAAGHEVLVYAYAPVTQSFGVPVIVVPTGSPFARWRWLRGQLAADRPDVVSLHYVNVDSFALAMFGGPPLVLSVWGSDILVELPESAAKRLLVSAAMRRAALVVSPARHMTERIERMGVRAERIVTAQYGVETDRFRPRRPREAPPLTVVCTRAFRPVYGIEDIIRAVPLVDEALVGSFVFAGDGPLLGDMRDLAESLGIARRCRFLGAIDHGGLPELLAEADIYCSMSRSDGTSLSLLEAMAAGLPCVVSDIPANREWVDRGEEGLLVPVGDPTALAAALEQLAGDVSLRQAMGVAAREAVVERGDRAANMARIVSAVEGVVR